MIETQTYDYQKCNNGKNDDDDQKKDNDIKIQTDSDE